HWLRSASSPTIRSRVASANALKNSTISGKDSEWVSVADMGCLRVEGNQLDEHRIGVRRNWQARNVLDRAVGGFRWAQLSGLGPRSRNRNRHRRRRIVLAGATRG